MDESRPRLFADEAEIRSIGERLLDRSLPLAEWTHEAHLAACLWLLTARTDIDIDRQMRTIISGYNEAAGGVNDDHHGYHDSITHSYLAGVRSWLKRCAATDLLGRVNGLLREPEGQREWPLAFYSRERLFSVEARRNSVAPDLRPLP